MTLNIRETRYRNGKVVEAARAIRGLVTNSPITTPITYTDPAKVLKYNKDGVHWSSDSNDSGRTLLKYPAEDFDWALFVFWKISPNFWQGQIVRVG